MTSPEDPREGPERDETAESDDADDRVVEPDEDDVEPSPDEDPNWLVDEQGRESFPASDPPTH